MEVPISAQPIDHVHCRLPPRNSPCYATHKSVLLVPPFPSTRPHSAFDHIAPSFLACTQLMLIIITHTHADLSKCNNHKKLKSQTACPAATRPCHLQASPSPLARFWTAPFAPIYNMSRTLTTTRNTSKHYSLRFPSRGFLSSPHAAFFALRRCFVAIIYMYTLRAPSTRSFFPSSISLFVLTERTLGMYVRSAPDDGHLNCYISHESPK